MTKNTGHIPTPSRANGGLPRWHSSKGIQMTLEFPSARTVAIGEGQSALSAVVDIAAQHTTGY